MHKNPQFINYKFLFSEFILQNGNYELSLVARACKLAHELSYFLHFEICVRISCAFDLKTQYSHSVGRCKNDPRREDASKQVSKRRSSSTWQTRLTPTSFLYFLSPRVRISPQIDCQIVNRGRADNFANSIPSIFARWERVSRKQGRTPREILPFNQVRPVRNFFVEDIWISSGFRTFNQSYIVKGVAKYCWSNERRQ